MMSIREAGRRLRAREVSCVELVQDALRRVRRDAHLRAWITLTAEAALDEARRRDDEIRRGVDRGPLHGIPTGFKDLFFTRGVRTSGGSKLFADFVPDRDAVVVEQLRRAGAVSLGKLNLHELAYGVTSTNPQFGAVRNPRDAELVPGGSSGGSGAAVAAGHVFFSMGTDTGGSIRIPAAFCGIVGLKPTYDRISRAGCMPLADSLDHVGPLARSVADAACVLTALTNSRRSAHWDSPRAGIPENYYGDRLQPEVREAWNAAEAAAVRAGAEVVRVHVPHPEQLTEAAKTTIFCEASAVYAAHQESFGDVGADVRGHLDRGLTVPGHEYVRAQQQREAIRREWLAMFRDIDVLLTPTTPNLPQRIGETTVKIDGQEEDARMAATRLLRGINAIGFPALSMPSGAAAVQLVARPWEDEALLAFAALVERA